MSCCSLSCYNVQLFGLEATVCYFVLLFQFADVFNCCFLLPVSYSVSPEASYFNDFPLCLLIYDTAVSNLYSISSNAKFFCHACNCMPLWL